MLSWVMLTSVLGIADDMIIGENSLDGSDHDRNLAEFLLVTR